MYHSITFANDIAVYSAAEAAYEQREDLAGKMKGFNTWYDWRLIPSSRPAISHPERVTNYVTIPGRQGSIDITEYISTKPIYKDRTGSFEFYVMNEDLDKQLVRDVIYRDLHGRRMYMSFEDDPLYYYTGRFEISQWNNNSSYPTLSINYQVQPYKRRIGTGRLISDDM